MRAQGSQDKEGHLEPGVTGGQDQQGQGQGQGPLSKWGKLCVYATSYECEREGSLGPRLIT